MKILVHKDITENAVRMIKEVLSELDEIEVDVLDKDEQLIEKIRDVDVLIVRSKPMVTRHTIQIANKLKVIARLGVGLDNVDVEAAHTKGIKVINTPEATTTSVAELTIGLALSLLRNIPSAHSSVKIGKWERKKYVGLELSGKTWGVVGFGKIGKAVAKRLTPFDVKLLVYDPFVDKQTALEFKGEKVGLKELLSKCDIISIHVSLTPETKGMIGEEELNAVKKGAFLINISRGEVVQTKALYDVLKSNKLAGAALDVYEKEPPIGNPLLKLDNVVLTPHLGASTHEGQERAVYEALEKIKDLFKKVV